MALTLRLVGGLSTGEIARAFLVSEPTIAQRIVRAKRLIRARRLPYAVPEAAELPARIGSVLAVIYLVFNEGHTARAGDRLVRAGGLRGGASPRRHPRRADAGGAGGAGTPRPHGADDGAHPRAHRRAGRTGAAGRPGPRALGPRLHRARPRRGSTRAGSLEAAGPYRLQAAIAACHARAPTWEATDWPAIAALYARAPRAHAVAGDRAQPRGGGGDGGGAGGGAGHPRRTRGAGARRLPSPSRRARGLPAPSRPLARGRRRVSPRARRSPRTAASRRSSPRASTNANAGADFVRPAPGGAARPCRQWPSWSQGSWKRRK